MVSLLCWIFLAVSGINIVSLLTDEGTHHPGTAIFDYHYNLAELIFWLAVFVGSYIVYLEV